MPEKMIGDKAYDSDALDEEPAELGIELIAPHKRNPKKPKTQDDVNFGVTSDVGKSKGSLPGYKTTVELLLATSIIWIIFSASFI
jgi:hypothetical protein